MKHDDPASEAMIAEVRNRTESLGFELVDVRQRGGKRTSLQVRIDRPGSGPGEGVTADDCAVVSRAVEAWLDESGVLGPRYVLEVSSPGIERPIRWAQHWRRFEGHEVRVKLPDLGKVKATIVRVIDDDFVVLRLGSGEEVTVSLEDARDATLVVDWSQFDRSRSKTAN
jgi:ribosome maturation factor RimP